MATDDELKERREIDERKTRVLLTYGILLIVVIICYAAVREGPPIFHYIYWTVFVGVVVLFITAYVRASRPASPQNPASKGLDDEEWKKTVREQEKIQYDAVTAFLSKVVPIPDFNPATPEHERDRERQLLFRTRLFAAYHFFEQQTGRPLDLGEKRWVQKLIGIQESAVQETAMDTVFGAIGDTLKNIHEYIETTKNDIRQELTQYFGEQARHFSDADCAGLALMDPEDRVRRYNDLKELLREGTKLSQPIVDENALSETPTKEEVEDVGIDEDFLREITEEAKFNEYAELQRAKILVLYENDASKRDRRLRVFNNLAMRYRESRGW